MTIINGTITIQNLRDMAKTDPARLLRLIEQKELKPTAMTFAVEIAGEHIDRARVVPVLGHLGHCETAEERARAEAALMALPDEDKRRLFLIPARH